MNFSIRKWGQLNESVVESSQRWVAGAVAIHAGGHGGLNFPRWLNSALCVWGYGVHCSVYGAHAAMT